MESGIIGAITYTHTVAANFAPTDHANLCLGLYTGFPRKFRIWKDFWNNSYQTETVTSTLIYLSVTVQLIDDNINYW